MTFENGGVEIDILGLPAIGILSARKKKKKWANVFRHSNRLNKPE